ncbi:condensation domain-containing protein [Streptomyces antimicrobicus]|uniref:Condensation domain-containing protein n=1 Tax=Streptomyces antimicrobicus TaxID=2883108 RepID=A0ABS8B0Y2_9ACTN|nr:condensation domain-containing protein [Streptomyces antimicrobicus]MCB5178251.1 condensation domain-containing protein [Streptomyces antimicrobicus]
MTDEAYPLTFEEESIWISEQLFRQRSPYLETWAQRIEGPLDPEALRRAWEAFVLRHAALRTRFLLEDGGTVQRFAPEPPSEMEREQWPGGELEAVLREAGRRPLDLTRSPYRATLYERSPLDHVLLVQVHHIIVDDVSLSVLNEELGALYTAQVTGEAPALPPLAMEPGAYAVAQRAAGVSPAALDFWADYLADVTPLPQLPPYPRPLPPRRGPGTDMVSVVLPAETRKAVRDTARALRTTPHVVFAAAMAMTFSATVEVEDVVLGTPTSRRGAAELDRMFGCLTDLMPLRVHVPRTMSFAEACATTKKNVLTTLRHRQTPYAAISSNLRSAQSLRSSDNLARVVLVIDDDPGELVLPGLRCERVYVGAAWPKFDWCQYVVESGDQYLVRADYATGCFTPEEAERMMAQWATVVAAVTADTTVTPGRLAELLGSPATTP